MHVAFCADYLKRRQVAPSLWQMTAFLLNISVWDRFLGRDSLLGQETASAGWSQGTPTERQVSKRQVSKRQVSNHLVSKRPVSKRQVYKTTGLQNVRFQNVWFQNVQFLNLIYLLNKKYSNCKFAFLFKVKSASFLLITSQDGDIWQKTL
jgi:hypothetical protein